MASKQNSEHSYLHIVSGHTPWERLRVILNFLEDRKAAKKLQTAGDIKRRAILAKIAKAKKEEDEYTELMGEAELLEFEAMADTTKDGYEKLDEELKFLEQYVTDLRAITEPTRLYHPDGQPYTDSEMFEVNKDSEIEARILFDSQVAVISNKLGIPTHIVNDGMRLPNIRRAYQLASTIVDDYVGKPYQQRIEAFKTNDLSWLLVQKDAPTVPSIAEIMVHNNVQSTIDYKTTSNPIAYGLLENKK